MPRKDDIQGLLKDRFQRFEAEPQVDLWSEIEAELYPEKKKALKLWPYFSVAASIAILIFTWIYLGNTDSGVELNPNFVEEVTPGEPNIESHEQPSIDKELQEAPQLASEDEVEPQPVERITTPNKEKIQTQTPKKRQEIKSQPQPLLQKEEVMNRNLAKAEVPAEKKGQENESPIEVAPMAKELLAVNKSKLNRPEADQISVPQTLNKPALVEEEESNKLDLNNISFKNIVSLASDGIEKIKDASPVKVYEEKNDQGESKVYQLNLFNLSVSHKTQKRRNKKEIL